MKPTITKTVPILCLVTALTFASLACGASSRKDKAEETATPTPTSTAASTTEAPANSNTSTEIIVVVTATPETQQPADVAPASADTTAPSINETHPSHEVVYYGKGSCGPTRLTIEAQVSDDGSVSEVWIEHRFNGAATGGTVGEWVRTNLAYQNGSYSETVDMQFENYHALNEGNGVLEYQVVALDANGNESRYPNGSNLIVGVKVCK